VLEFAAQDWRNPDGSSTFPAPRTIDELRCDPQFREDAADAVNRSRALPGKGASPE